MRRVVRDYSLTGPEAARAVEHGLAGAAWYETPMDPSTRARLYRRTDGRAGFDAALWVALLVGSGVLAWWARESWLAVPAFLLYGMLYGGSSDARWHEFGHETAFRTRWLNTVLYYPACFMLLREPTVWRWSHVRHHSDTIVVGRDAEIAFPRPISIVTWLGNLLGLFAVPPLVRRIVRHARGGLDADVAEYVPADQHRRVVIEARVFLSILVAVVGWCVVAGTVWPVLFVGLPTFYGFWLVVFFGATQHAGLRENVLDHRLNTRTVRMNPVFRFLYLNMNYHLEHHMFPTVPYRNLPALHAEIADDLPPPARSTVAAYREILRAARAQRHDPDFELPRPVPDRAAPRPSTIVADVDDDGWVTICRSDTLAPGELRRVDVGDRTYAVCRTLDGSVRAVDGICTHSRVVHLADGAVVGDEIECPKHNGRFAFDSGRPTRDPVVAPVGVYPTAEVAGEVRVAVGRPGTG